jgi:SNF2 family DNA or RNA helicase
LKKHRITVAEVTGAVSKTDRTKIFTDFQTAEDPRALVADPGCVSHGLDLWQAQTVIWYAPIDKNEQYTQGNARAHRPGQKYPVTVVQLTSTALEREIFTRLQMRQSQQGVMLAAVKRGLN